MIFAQVYTAIADATIGCWESKYYYNFWRPVTAIQNANIDGNDQTVQDATWLPFTITAGHPEYPSAHGLHLVCNGAFDGVLPRHEAAGQGDPALWH